MEISNSKTAPHNYQAANQSQQQQQQQQQQPQQQAQQPQHRKQPSLARGRRNRYPPRSIPGRNTTEARPPARSSNGYGQGQSGQDGSPGPTNKLPANTFSAASPPLPPTTNAATESRETSPSPSTPPPTDQKTEHIKYAAEAALENFIAHLEALMLCPPAPWRGDILSAVLSEHLCLISSCSRNIHPIDNRIHHAARKLSMLKQSGNLHLILPIVPPPVDTAYRPYPAPMANPPTTTYQDNLTTPSSPTVSRPPQDQSDPALREFADPASSDQAIHGPPEQFQIPQRQPVGPQPNPSPHLPQGHLPVPNHSPAIQDPIIGTAPATPVQMTSLPDIDQHHSTMPHLCKSASRLAPPPYPPHVRPHYQPYDPNIPAPIIPSEPSSCPAEQWNVPNQYPIAYTFTGGTQTTQHQIPAGGVYHAPEYYVCPPGNYSILPAAPMMSYGSSYTGGYQRVQGQNGVAGVSTGQNGSLQVLHGVEGCSQPPASRTPTTE